MKRILLLFILLIALVLTMGCQQTEVDSNYINEKYGFSFRIPSNWDGKYEIIDAVDGIIDFKYTGYEDHQGGGYQEFFFIGVATIEEYEQRLHEPRTGILLAEGDEYAYILNIPLDNIILDKEKNEEYIEIRLSEEEIKDRFSIIGLPSASKEQKTFNGEKEPLTQEIIELNEIIAEKNEEINRLKKLNSNKMTEIKELRESIEMVRFSAYARVDDSFDNLKNIYNISSKHMIKDDWYVIQENYFDIELLGYEHAEQVDFYYLRLESDEGEKLIYSDTAAEDGWKFISDNIGEIINKHKQSSSGGFSYEPYYVIFMEVTLNDGDVVRTPKLPIYRYDELGYMKEQNVMDSELKEEYYFEPNVSIIEGRLITRLHYGPPRFGEDPDNDEQRYPFILLLDEPINIIAEDTDTLNSNKSNVSEIQLVLKGKPYVDMAKQYKNKYIRVQGTLFTAFTGYHHTEVLIDVDEIKINSQ